MDVEAAIVDPKRWNRYAYAGNNPLKYIDPAGLDFYLVCGEDSATCQDGYVGTYNDKQVFQRTIVTSLSLSDPRSGTSAAVDGNGLMITTSTGKFQGVFINNTPSVDVAGVGRFEGFTFHIDHSDVKVGVLSAGSATFDGSLGQASRALQGNGSWVYRLDTRSLNPFHSSDARHFRFGQGPSPHFVVSPTASPSIEFHVDSAVGYKHVWCASFARVFGGCQ